MKNDGEEIFENYKFGENEGYSKQGVEFYATIGNKTVLAVNFADANMTLKLAIEEAQKKERDRVFAELDAVAWEHIEPEKLKQFYEEFSKAEDEESALEIAKKYSIVGFSAEKYEAVKKHISRSKK